jgi:hypothetical protein
VSDLYTIFPRSVRKRNTANRRTDGGNICIIPSQIHECRNWERGRAVSFLGIFVSNFQDSACGICVGQDGVLHGIYMPPTHDDESTDMINTLSYSETKHSRFKRLHFVMFVFKISLYRLRTVVTRLQLLLNEYSG